MRYLGIIWMLVCGLSSCAVQRVVVIDPNTLVAIPPEVAWNYLRTTVNESDVATTRICRIGDDNSISDYYIERFSTFMDSTIPDWSDGERISSTTNPENVTLSFASSSTQWAVRARFYPTARLHCNSDRNLFGDVYEYCRPSDCIAWVGFSKSGMTEAEATDTFNRIATAGASVGMIIQQGVE